MQRAPSSPSPLARAVRVAHRDGLRTAGIHALAELGLYRRLVLYEATPKPEPLPDTALDLGFLGEDELEGVGVAPERLGRGERCFGGRLDGRLVVTVWLTETPARVRYLDGTILLDPGELYLYALHTHRAYRGHGAATAVLRAVVPALAGECERLVAAVLPENRAAVRSFHAAGRYRPFATIGWVGIGGRRRWFRRELR